MSNEPITRKEMFMAKASGENVNTPEPITREEKYLDKIAKNGGKATIWKDIGEKTVMGDTLTWDGNTEGLEVGTFVMDDGVTANIFRISEATPSIDEITNGSIITFADGSTVKSDELVDVGNVIGDNFVAIFNDVLCIAYEDNIVVRGTDTTVTIPKKGIYAYEWVVDEPGDNITVFTINGFGKFEQTEITPLPNKYLDIVETVGSDTLTWDGNTEGLESADVMEDGSLFYRVTEVYPTAEESQNGGVVCMPILGELAVSFTDLTGDLGFESYIFANANGAVPALCVSQNITVEGMGDLYKGIYLAEGISSLTINGYTGFPKEQVKQEYIKDVILAVLTEKGLLS